MKRAPSGWSGRNDGEGAEHLRWHNAIRPWPDIPGESGTVLLGFSSDEGVRRNLGRPGARKAPDALRSALSSMAIHNSGPLYDAGDICVEEKNSRMDNWSLVICWRKYSPLATSQSVSAVGTRSPALATSDSRRHH